MANSKCRWEAPNQWNEWSEWLAAGLHARNRWRLPVLLLGILFASGRRTVTTWLRAAGVSDDFQDYYYFLAAVGRKTNSIATQLVVLILRTLPLPERLLLVIDDSPTKRYGPKVEGADVHHNPTPGPADQPFLYGHVWVTISLALRHPKWGPIGLPLQAMLYVRKRTMATIPKVRGWQRFATKLQLAARLVEWIVPILKKAGKTVWIVVDGGYTKRPFLRRVLKLSNVVVVGRLAQRRGLARLAAEAEERPTPRSRPATQVRQESFQSGQTRRAQARLADHCLHGLRRNDDQDLQDLPGNLRAGGRRHSRRARQGRSWLVRLLLHRSECQRQGDSRSVCRSCYHRTRFPRRERSVGIGPTASAQHLDQSGRVQSESVDAYAGRSLGVEQKSRATWSTAATRRGTTPIAGLRTPIAAKPCASRFSETNYRRLPTHGRSHEKSSA